MSETREALAPCPFCGCKARILETQTDVAVACEGCCVENHFINDIRDTGRSRAIAAWNRRALSARDERAEEKGWMPIETAPKDGTTVAVARDMGETWGWVRGIASYESAKGIAGWVARCGFSEIPGVLGLGSPTHWQPLPAPPAAIRAGGTDGH